MAKASAEAWNRLYPSGTDVRCFPTYGMKETSFVTRTKSEAWVENGHTAMVMVEGQSCAWALTNVDPLHGSSEVTGQPHLLPLPHEAVMVIRDMLPGGEEVAA